MLGSLGRLGLVGLLAFGPPPARSRSLRVKVELPEGIGAGPVAGLLSCPGQEARRVELTREGEATLSGNDGDTCLLDVRLAPGRHLQAQVEFGDHTFAHLSGVEVVVEAAPERPRTPVTTDRLEAKSLPVGGSTSRDFTATVELMPTASVDAAGISLAGSTGAEVSMHAGFGGDQFSAGTLTAAGVDDLASSTGFARFMAENGQVDGVEAFPDQWTGLRILDPKGRPARGVPVQLGDRVLKTHADGRVVFLEGRDAPFRGRRIEVNVDGRRSVLLRRGRISTIKLAVPKRQFRHRVDLALVLDTTGSMSDELRYLQVELRAVLDRIERQFPDVDIRWALVVYRDVGDRYVVRSVDFTKDFDAFDRAIDAQAAEGGGDNPEAVRQAFATVEDLRWRRPDVTNRLVLHVADAPPHAQDLLPSLEVVDRLREEGTRIYPVAASGTDDASEFFMRAAALMTGGQYVFLTDDSGLGRPHRGATAACYQVHSFASVLGDILEAEVQGERPSLPTGDRANRCGRGGAAPPSQFGGRPGTPRRAPRSPRADLERSLLDDDAEAAHLHRPFVRHGL